MKTVMNNEKNVFGFLCFIGAGAMNNKIIVTINNIIR